MTASPITAPFTPDKDLLRTPDSNSMELVDGQIVEKHGSAESSHIEGIFCFRFQLFLNDNPIADVFSGSLGYQCFNDPNRIRKPDATVIRLDRLRKLPDADPDFMPIVPDLAVEVIAPTETVYEVDRRINEYLTAGFPLVWVAKPVPRTITVYSRRGRPVIHTAEDEITADPLPGFLCKVAEFFPPATARPR